MIRLKKDERDDVVSDLKFIGDAMVKAMDGMDRKRQVEAYNALDAARGRLDSLSAKLCMGAEQS